MQQLSFDSMQIDHAAKQFRRRRTPGVSSEIKVVCLRECPAPRLVDTPERARDYWIEHVATAPHYDPMKEQLVVLALSTRRTILCHNLVALGTLDTIHVTPREIFRPLVAVAAAAFIIMHNHPSGDPTPSEADIKVTRDFIRAGQLMKIDLLDHVIVGATSHAISSAPWKYSSLRELGYFYS